MRTGRRALAAAALAAALAAAPAGTAAPAVAVAVASPVPTPSPSPGVTAPPTADPSLPTPTRPHPGLPPLGTAPDGSTVGGESLASRGTVLAGGARPLPRRVVADGLLVADAGTGEVLAARDPHGRYYPASTLKLLTLLALEPRLDPDAVVVGTVEDEAIEGSRVGLVAGGRYPVRLLQLALVMQSGNDAANALARAAGGTAAAVRAMQEVADDLGAHDTVVGSPAGLDVAGQSSSPYDLALVMRAVLDRPQLAALLTVPTAQMPRVRGRSPGYQIQNQNPLLGTAGHLGGKTGFTDAARHTFVAAAERGGRRLVVSVMRTENRPLRAAEQAGLLLDWGFAVPPGTPGVGRLVDPGEVAADIAAAAATAAAEEAAAAASAAAAPDRAPLPADAEDTALVGWAAAGGVLLVLLVAGPGVRRALRLRRSRAPAPPPAGRERAGGTPSTPS